MTIQEAIKSGKPFKRRDWDDYDYIYVRTDDVMCARGCKHPTYFKTEDIFATDWEIKP